MITVKSRDLELVRRAHKRFPKLIQKTFPAAVREEIKPLLADIRTKQAQQNWSKNFVIAGSPPANTRRIKTRKIRMRREIGARLTPFFQGLAVLQERGSYKAGIRKKKSGASTGRLKPKESYSPAWLGFRSRGKTSIQSSFLKATDKVMRSELRRRGLT